MKVIIKVVVYNPNNDEYDCIEFGRDKCFFRNSNNRDSLERPGSNTTNLDDCVQFSY